MHYILLLARGPSELGFVETALQRGSRRDVVLLHELDFAAGLSLLQACPVGLILFDPALRQGRLEEAEHALRLQACGTPIVLIGRPTGQTSRRLLIRLPRGVQAVVSHGDAAGLLRTLDVVFGPV